MSRFWKTKNFHNFFWLSPFFMSVTLPEQQNPQNLRAWCSNQSPQNKWTQKSEVRGQRVLTHCQQWQVLGPWWGLVNTCLVNTCLVNTSWVNTSLVNTVLVNTGLVNTSLVNTGLVNTSLVNTSLVNTSLWRGITIQTYNCCLHSMSEKTGNWTRQD